MLWRLNIMSSAFTFCLLNRLTLCVLCVSVVNCVNQSFCTWTIAAMSIGSMARGKRRMLKSDIDVNAFSASRILSGLTETKTANAARETWNSKKKKKCTVQELTNWTLRNQTEIVEHMQKNKISLINDRQIKWFFYGLNFSLNSIFNLQEQGQWWK